MSTYLVHLITFFSISVLVFDDLITCAQECPSDKNMRWSYGRNASNGPQYWGELPDSECDGDSQSPINIVKSSVEIGKDSTGLQLSNYDKPITKATIRNNGHTVEVTPKDGIQRSITVEGSSYELQQFHFHWGHKIRNRQLDHSSPGSEHTINGRQYSMEAHLVHSNKDNKLVVVGVFLQKSWSKNPIMKNILSEAESYQFAGEETEVTYKDKKSALNLVDMVKKGCPYYTYQGSLTTPPCTEGVTWMICKKLSYVGVTQLWTLEGLHSVSKSDENVRKCHIVDNFRPVQELNGRTVTSG